MVGKLFTNRSIFIENVNCLMVLFLTLALMLSCSGYMAPEYIERYVLSKESDIYSLGVIIIEIVTGERKYPVGTSNEEFVEVGRSSQLTSERFSSTYYMFSYRPVIFLALL
jgi:serine/threonine protein kinase